MVEPTITWKLREIEWICGQWRGEISVIAKMEKKQTDGVKKLLRDEQQKYPYPAFIAVENHGNSYEYALLSGENQITYIYTLFGSGYSIYVRAQGSGAISYDYMLN